eukprot:scaffold468_cov216-Pinguiococcus_pyrenoidosus.AAC.6
MEFSNGDAVILLLPYIGAATLPPRSMQKDSPRAAAPAPRAPQCTASPLSLPTRPIPRTAPPKEPGRSQTRPFSHCQSSAEAPLRCSAALRTALEGRSSTAAAPWRTCARQRWQGASPPPSAAPNVALLRLSAAEFRGQLTAVEPAPAAWPFARALAPGGPERSQ